MIILIIILVKKNIIVKPTKGRKPNLPRKILKGGESSSGESSSEEDAGQEGCSKKDCS